MIAQWLETERHHWLDPSVCTLPGCRDAAERARYWEDEMVIMPDETTRLFERCLGHGGVDAAVRAIRRFLRQNGNARNARGDRGDR